MIPGYNDFKAPSARRRAPQPFWTPVAIAAATCSFLGSFFGTTLAMWLVQR